MSSYDHAGMARSAWPGPTTRTAAPDESGLALVCDSE